MIPCSAAIARWLLTSAAYCACNPVCKQQSIYSDAVVMAGMQPAFKSKTVVWRTQVQNLQCHHVLMMSLTLATLFRSSALGINKLVKLVSKVGCPMSNRKQLQSYAFLSRELDAGSTAHPNSHSAKVSRSACCFSFFCPGNHAIS